MRRKLGHEMYILVVHWLGKFCISLKALSRYRFVVHDEHQQSEFSHQGFAGSNAVGGFWEQWVFLLNNMLYRFWNLSNQWFKKLKLWSGSNSSSICFPRLTNHHFFTGFPWCLIAIHSLYSFSSIDACAAWPPRLPDRAFVLRACIFSICRTQVLN